MGVLSILLILKQSMNDLWLESFMFYKFGTIYRPWLLHFDLDICATLSGRPTSDIMAKMLANYWEKYVSKEKCPFRNGVNVTLNADNSSSNVMFDKIPRMPDGDYKMQNRFHTRGNETTWWCDLKFTIKSKAGINRTSMLDMG